MAMALSQDEDLEHFYSASIDTKLEIGTFIYAKSGYLNTPRDFYIIPRQLMMNLPVLTKIRMQCPPEELKVNAQIIYPSQTVKRNVRGIIQNIKERCSIYAIDYGFTEDNINKNDVYLPLHEEALTTPPLAVRCEMYLCCPLEDNFSEEAIKAFKYYMGDSNREMLKLYLKGKVNDKFIVTVYNSCSNDISTMLFLVGDTTYQSVENFCRAIPDHYQEPEITFSFRKSKLGRKFDARVQYVKDETLFYAIPITHYEKYVETRAEFHSYCETMFELNTGDCVINAAVGVRGESGIYERGIITDVIASEEKIKIKLIDVGKEVIVGLSDAVPVYSEEYTQVKSYCIYCKTLPNFNPLNLGLPEDVLKAGSPFRITIVQVGDELRRPNVVAISKMSSKVDLC